MAPKITRKDQNWVAEGQWSKRSAAVVVACSSMLVWELGWALARRWALKSACASHVAFWAAGTHLLAVGLEDTNTSRRRPDARATAPRNQLRRARCDAALGPRPSGPTQWLQSSWAHFPWPLDSSANRVFGQLEHAVGNIQWRRVAEGEALRRRLTFWPHRRRHHSALHHERSAEEALRQDSGCRFGETERLSFLRWMTFYSGGVTPVYDYVLSFREPRLINLPPSFPAEPEEKTPTPGVCLPSGRSASTVAHEGCALLRWRHGSTSFACPRVLSRTGVHHHPLRARLRTLHSCSPTFQAQRPCREAHRCMGGARCM